MDNITLEYTSDGFDDISENIKNFNQLVNRLEKLKNEAAKKWDIVFTVDVIIENIGRISIALNDRSILSFMSEDISMTSLGDINAEGVKAYFFGAYTEMSNKYIVPYEDGLEAIKFWLENGIPGNQIKWTEELY